MNFDILRQKILEKAIRGELVPQLESEPEVEQIGEVPEEVPFEIPDKWKWVQLSSVGKIVGGGTPKTGITAYWGGKISWITPADLGKIDGRYVSYGAKSITQTGLNHSSAKLLPSGSVVYSSRAPIGHIAIAGKELCTNQGCKSFIPSFKTITAEWGYFCLIARTPDIISRASGTTFKEISGSGVGATWIPLPPLAEQHRIVDQLDALLAVIEVADGAFKDLHSLSENLRSKVIQMAIEGKLVPQLESEPEVEQIGEAPEEVPFEIPKKWKWMSFDCVVKTFPSKNYQIQTKEIALEGKYPVISQAKAKIDGYCDDESKLIPRDKIPFVIFGDHTRVVKFVNQQCVIGADGTKLLRSDVYDISFLFYVIVFLAQNLREAGYSRHFKFLKARALPVPPLAEQRRIVARVNELLSLLDELH